MTPNLPPLAKQALGAGVGVIAALTLYGGYTLAAPPVQAMLSSVFPSGTEVTYTEADRAGKQADIAERARDLINDRLDE